MKALDITPRLIGHTLRVEADNVHIEGQLQDLAVLTETLLDHKGSIGTTETAYLSGVILRLDSHELRLHGNEEITIIGKVNR